MKIPSGMKEPHRRFSSLGRPVDRRYPTNRAIAALSLVVVAVALAAHAIIGETSLEALFEAVVLGLGFFLAWALARELDPDHDYSAFVAAALSLIPGLALGRSGIAAVLLVLLAVRMVNRTVGPSARALDTLGVLALTGFAVWQGHPVLAAAAAGAFALDALLKPPHRVHLAAAGASLGLLAVGISGYQTPEELRLGAVAWFGLFLTTPFLLLIRGSSSPRAVPDEGGSPLSGRRVQAAQWLGLATLAASVLAEGRTGLAVLSPLWAAIVGTGLYFSIGAPTRFPHSVQDPS